MLDPIAVTARQLAVEWRRHYEPLLDGTWWFFAPITCAPRAQQGWKLHVSATPLTAVSALRRVAAVVMPLGLPWKAARSVDELEKLCAPPTPVSQVGKFITVYVQDEVELPALAERLHAATVDLDGPLVPSDRRYAPGSNVYLRYGGFSARQTYTGPDQICDWYVVDPAGRQVVDERAPGRYRPDWVAEPPLPPRPAPPTPTGPGLFGRGIAVSTVLRQSARGVVVRATWRGREVVLKEARIGTIPDRTGGDARNRLHNEWQVLQRLAGSGLAPEALDYFVEEGNAYLVEEMLPGETLRSTIERAAYVEHPGVGWLRDLCRAVADLAAGLRRHGVEPRDLTPDNIMVHRGQCTAIDVELCRLEDSTEPPFPGWTPGYGHPRVDAAPDVSDGDFAVAAITSFILTGIDPYLTPSHDIAGHVDAILAAFGPDDADLVRPELALVRARMGPPLAASLVRAEVPGPDADQVLAAAVEAGDELVRRVEWDERSWPWPRAWRSEVHHPACFYAGTAGIVRYYLDLWEATDDRDWLRRADELLDWTFARHPYVPGHTPPGLHFGVGALPWLAAEIANAADARRAAALRAQALQLADELTAAEPGRPDITHGHAGIGLAQLGTHLASGDDGCARAAQRTAHRVLASASEAAGLLVWPRGDAHTYGHAHGSAGIGQFLLMTGLVTDDPVLVGAGLGIARALVALGVTTAAGRGLGWRPGPVESDPPWPHWCNGTAGVGAFVLSAASASADDALADAAKRAGRAITGARAFDSCGRCHGLAGHGDFLLDLAHAGHGEEFRDGARRIDRKLAALALRSGFAWKWPPAAGEEPQPSYMVGYSGVHAFRLRLAGLIDRAPLTVSPRAHSAPAAVPD